MISRAEMLDISRALADAAERMPDEPIPNGSKPQGLVTESHLSENTGYSVSRLESMRRRGDVEQGLHWFLTPNNGIAWDGEAFELWQKGVTSADIRAYKLEKTGLSVYESNTAARGSGKVSNIQPRLPDSSKRRGSGKKS